MNRAILWLMIAAVVYIVGVAGFLSVHPAYEDDPRNLTAGTIASFALKRFNHVDTIVDGRLLLDEFCGRIPRDQPTKNTRCRLRFARMDADRDGQVSSREMVDFYLKALRTADRNGDGRVTEEEWLGAMQVN
jgi:Ca2+-binding EF-hand superfamily protein